MCSMHIPLMITWGTIHSPQPCYQLHQSLQVAAPATSSLHVPLVIQTYTWTYPCTSAAVQIIRYLHVPVSHCLCYGSTHAKVDGILGLLLGTEVPVITSEGIH